MIYGSVCSGIEAASVAWEPLGWRPAFFSEIDAFPRAVLTHRFPGVPLHGDFTTIEAGQYDPIDLLVGGTPCQSFSVAGLRGGLGDDRGNLALEYLRLADRLRPRWLVWENVPGVLSSNGGRDFGAILGGMVELGYGFAYGVRDAQYVRVDGLERAVPQRRRRVFVVGHLGDWRRAAAVLFERESLSGHPPPRREAGQGVAGGAALSVALRGREGGGTAELGGDFADTLRASTGGGDKPHALIAANSGTPLVPLAAGAHVPAIAFGWQNSASQGASVSEHITPSLDKSKVPAIAFDAYNQTVSDVSHPLRVGFGNGSGDEIPQTLQDWAVRRLTPTECERLQGFPDGWTDVPYRGKPAADGPRYKALGNSMACNVMRWIGRRIEMVDAIREAA